MSNRDLMADEMATTSGGAQVASQRIANVIAERILTGVLAPGTRIKQEELAAELDASRVPVREALRILESRGLVVLRSNSGAWVAAMTEHDLSLSYQIRERIEPLLLQDSMPRLTPADFIQLHALQHAIEQTTDVEEFLVLDRELHWLTYSGHRAPQLAAMIARLWDTTQHYRREFIRLSGGMRSWVTDSEHRLLIEAVEHQDSVAAGHVLTLHIERTRLALHRHPELFADSPAGERQSRGHS